MHYELTEETKQMRGMTAYRIRALVDMPDNDVEKGDLGGFVTKDSFISKDTWVGGDASVWSSILEGNNRIDDNACVEKSHLFGECNILQHAFIANSKIAGVYATGQIRVKDSELSVNTPKAWGYLLEEKASLINCQMTYTAEVHKRIHCAGKSKLEKCNVKGERIVFSGDSSIKDSTFEGESIFLNGIELAYSLNIKGKQIDVRDAKELIEVKMKNAFQVELIGKIQMAHSLIQGESIVIKGDEIVIKTTNIQANLVKILDAVNLRYVTMTDFDIELSDYVSLIGNSMDRIRIGQEVTMRDLVKVHINSRMKSMEFNQTCLSGDVHLTGI